MPREVEKWDESRLIPAQPEYSTQAMPMKPAAPGDTYEVEAGQPLSFDPATKKGIPFLAADVATKPCIGLNEWPVTVDDKGYCWLGLGGTVDRTRGGNVTLAYFNTGVFDPQDLVGDVEEAMESWGAEELQNGFVRKA